MNGFVSFFVNMFGGLFDKRLWGSVGGSRSTASHESVSEDSALNYSAVWCATRLLCGTGAALPLPVYSGRDTEDRTKDRAHRVHQILNGSPNPEQTAYNFRSVMWQWQVNWGNAHAEIVREGNEPEGELVALWPLHPERVTPSRDENGNLFYRVKNEAGKPPDDLEPWQMFHVPSLITYDGLIGHGVIAHARECIGAGIAAEKYGANFFGGGGMPQVVIKHAGAWNADVRTAFKKEWEEIHSGADGSRVAVLGGGAEAVPLSFSAQDSQFIESRQFDVEEVARWYGIPPHLLHHLLRATFSNVEELGINFVQYSLIPWLRIWEQCIWHKLLRPQEQQTHFAEHNVDALLRGNSAARAAFYQSLIPIGVMRRNEARKLENLDPVDGGDTFLVQGAMVPLDEEGMPVSKFVNGDQSAQPSLTNDSEPATTGRKVLNDVAGRLNRIINHDLGRFLTKETKAMASFAKKPDEFVQLVDRFYVDHTTIVRDEMTETFGALGACGVPANVEQFVASWVNEGKAMMLDASGSAKPDELLTRIQGAVESRTWTERPLRAAERVKNAIVVV
jgi:HK97 family phage portal protein